MNRATHVYSNSDQGESKTPSLNASNAETVLRLPPITSSFALAAACRDAWRTFVEQSAHWGKAELIMWSLGPYARITRYAPTHASDGVTQFDDFRTIDARFVDRLLRNARAKTLDVLRSFASGAARREFALGVPSTGLVIRCEDTSGIPGYIPLPVRERLADRVLSLVAADMLTRPADFSRQVLCADCGAIDLDTRPCCARSQLRNDGLADLDAAWDEAG